MEAVLAAEVRVVALIQSSPLGFWPIGIIPPVNGFKAEMQALFPLVLPTTVHTVPAPVMSQSER
jgi:hypothetical protein